MEVPYYSAKVVQLPPVCYHCGGASKASLSNDTDIQALQKLHDVVRPICTFCKNEGKSPATRGTKFKKVTLKPKIVVFKHLFIK